MGSKAKPCRAIFCLGLASLGVNQSPEILHSALMSLCETWYPGSSKPEFVRTWISVAICVSILLSVKLGQWYINLTSDDLQLLRVEAAVVRPSWGWKEETQPGSPGSRGKGSRPRRSRQNHEYQALSGQRSAGVALLMSWAWRCPLTMMVLHLWGIFVARGQLVAHSAADWSRRRWRCWNSLTSPESPLPWKLADGAGGQAWVQTKPTGSGASLAGCCPLPWGHAHSSAVTVC